MSFLLDRFDDVTLPAFTVTEDIGTAPSSFAYVDLPNGGTFDAWGSDQAPSADQQIVRRCEIVESDAEAMLTSYRQWRARRGKKARLVRRALATGEEEWVTARLGEVKCQRSWQHFGYLELVLPFTVAAPVVWNGAETDTTITDIFSSGGDDLLLLGAESGTDNPNTFSLINSGNAPVRSITFSITAGSNPIGFVEIVNSTTGHTFSWDGTLAAGETLVIDCGAKSVLNDGDGDYDPFTEPTDKAFWMELAPGANLMSVEFDDTSADHSLRIQYHAAWE